MITLLRIKLINRSFQNYLLTLHTKDNYSRVLANANSESQSRA